MSERELAAILLIRIIGIFQYGYGQIPIFVYAYCLACWRSSLSHVLERDLELLVCI